MEKEIWVIRFITLDRIFYHFVTGSRDWAEDEAEFLKLKHDFESYTIARG
jgi:hypothetical protein